MPTLFGHENYEFFLYRTKIHIYLYVFDICLSLFGNLACMNYLCR